MVTRPIIPTLLAIVAVTPSFIVKLKKVDSPPPSGFVVYVPDAAATIVEVPDVNVPALLLQLPLTVIVEPFAVKMPPAPIVTTPAVTARLDPDVSSAVVEAPSLTVRVPPSRS